MTRCRVMRALVLGGGGITGIGWELGIVAGLAAAGVRLEDADLVVGTSAGSVVGGPLLSGTSVEDLYTGQLRPAAGEIAAALGVGGLARWVFASLSSGTRAPCGRGQGGWRCMRRRRRPPRNGGP